MMANYKTLHDRVYRARGRARDQACLHCDSPAAEWATIHGRDGMDPWADYMPLCRRCHRQYDLGGRERPAEVKAKIAGTLTGREITPEWREKIAGTLRGRSLSAEHRAAISAGLKRRKVVA